MTVHAYAKINLGLHVVGKRPDGYHNIETIFHQIDLCDDIELHEGDDEIHLLCFDPGVPNDRTNLCLRAAMMLRDLTGITSGVEIALIKRIPVGAGLGGGSADAAAVLLGLRRLWSLDITDDELQTLSLSLGSDVPFFIRGGTAFATGRGERLEPFPISLPYWILVLTSPVSVSTAWAYSHVKLAPDRPREDLRSVLSAYLQQPEQLKGKLRNDFEEAVLPAFPQIGEAKRQLERQGALFALMSGSGSAVFGFFAEEEQARSAWQALSSYGHISLTGPFFTPPPS